MSQKMMVTFQIRIMFYFLQVFLLLWCFGHEMFFSVVSM